MSNSTPTTYITVPDNGSQLDTLKSICGPEAGMRLSIKGIKCPKRVADVLVMDINNHSFIEFVDDNDAQWLTIGISGDNNERRVINLSLDDEEHYINGLQDIKPTRLFIVKANLSEVLYNFDSVLYLSLRDTKVDMINKFPNIVNLALDNVQVGSNCDELLGENSGRVTDVYIVNCDCSVLNILKGYELVRLRIMVDNSQQVNGYKSYYCGDGNQILVKDYDIGFEGDHDESVENNIKKSIKVV